MLARPKAWALAPDQCRARARGLIKISTRRRGRSTVRTHEPAGRTGTMTTIHAFEIGILGGIVLFFVLQRLGILDRWFDNFSG